MIHQIRTIDAHAAGEPLRLIVDGFPAPRGRTMLEKSGWVRKKQDRLRRALMLEPRGHADMYGAMLTEPVSAECQAGVLFMHTDGYSTMSGHGIIAVTTIALERGLLMPGADGRTVAFDTPAGVVRAVASFRDDAALALSRSKGEFRVERVAFVNVPSFVLHGGLAVKLGSRQVRADVAFGGAFYAIVDSESVGLPLDAAHLPELRRAGMAIKDAIESTHPIAHPLEPGLTGIDGTIFTGPAHGEVADLRNVTIFADAQVDRSPCGTGTAAVMAVIDAMGWLSDDRPFVHESLVGSLFEGRVSARTPVSLFTTHLVGDFQFSGARHYMVDRDGQRFLVDTVKEVTLPITVLLNWKPKP